MTSDESVCDMHRGQDKMGHFSCPEGYLDNLSGSIMSRIDALETPQVKVQAKQNWWAKSRIALYVAASLVGVFFAYQAVLSISEQNPSAGTAQVDVKDDAYTRYYEDYAGRLVGNEIEHELDQAQYM